MKKQTPFYPVKVSAPIGVRTIRCLKPFRRRQRRFIVLQLLPFAGAQQHPFRVKAMPEFVAR